MQRKKILLYAQDGAGLGHLRRLCRVAEALQDTYTVLIVSGKKELSWMCPSRAEFARIPPWGIFGLGTTSPTERLLHSVSRSETIKLVTSILEGIERSFAPDCILLDYTFFGMYGELWHLLHRTKARVYVTSRGVLDAHDVHWFRDGSQSAGTIISGLFIASDERTSDFTPLNTPAPHLLSKTFHVGYVMPQSIQREAVRARYGIETGSWVVCSAGGGKHAEDFLQQCAHIAERFSDVRFDIVTGPYADTRALQNGPNVTVHSTAADLSDMHAASDVAVINGGYNSILEAARGGSRIIVYPNQSNPEGEQVLHARRLAPLYPVTLISNLGSLEQVIHFTVTQTKENARPYFALNCDGAQGIKTHLDRALQY